MSRNIHREIIQQKIERKIGMSLKNTGIPYRQMKRVADLSEVLHETLIIEEMTRVEVRKSRTLSSRIASPLRPSRKSELENSLQALESLKNIIWLKCDEISSDIVQGLNSSNESTVKIMPDGNTNVMKCHTCGHNVTILSYNNYKCSNCGLGYSARDYVYNLVDLVKKL